MVLRIWGAMPNTQADTMWHVAIRDAESRIESLDRERRRLIRACRLMRRQIKAGVPWPTDDVPSIDVAPSAPPLMRAKGPAA